MPNDLLRAARERQPSANRPGEPMSRGELAERVNTMLYGRDRPWHSGFDANYVGKLERGQIRWPSPEYRKALRAVLDVDRDEDLGFHDRRRGRPVEVSPMPVDVGTAGFRADRRGVAKLLATLLLAASPSTSGALAAVVGGSRRVSDPRILDGHAAVAAALARMYRHADPHVVLPLAVKYADELLTLLDTGLPRLAPLVVDVHAEVGLWACHANLLPVARRHLAVADEVAAATNDPHLRARTLGALSYLYSSAPRGGSGGDPRRALNLLDAAITMAGSADPFTRGWLATWRADQLAAVGDAEGADAEVDRAQAHLDADDSGGVDGFFSRSSYGYGMHGHLASVRALVYALRRRTDEAENAFGLVYGSAANTRRQTATLCHRAAGLVFSGQAEAAAATLSHAVLLAQDCGYDMGVQRVLGVRSRFASSWSSVAAVRELDERLAAVGGPPATPS